MFKLHFSALSLNNQFVQSFHAFEAFERFNQAYRTKNEAQEVSKLIRNDKMILSYQAETT